MTELFKKHPIIAAVRDGAALEAAAASACKAVFLLQGNIIDLAENVAMLKKHGKRVFIHTDLMDGLKPDRAGLRFLAETVKPSGIISTRPSVIKAAGELGLKGVLRVFMIDAGAFATGLSGIRQCSPALVEVMPGLLPDVITKLGQQIGAPIVAGGLITTAAQARAALEAGAVAISTSKQSLWEL